MRTPVLEFFRERRHVFTADELDECRVIASEWRIPKANSAVRSRRINLALSELGMQFIGVKAEYAVAKILGVRFNRESSLSGDDKISDLHFRGWSVQVKSYEMNDRARVELILNLRSEFRADLIVVAVHDSPSIVSAIGWVTRTEFWCDSYRKDYGFGMRRAYLVRRMHALSELWALPLKPLREPVP